VLGSWWSEGAECRFSWRGGRLEARFAGDAPDEPPVVFRSEGPDLLRTESGPERGERLEIERDADGRAARLHWATYPFTRSPRPFGAP
jgi:hypothetical protein